MAVPTNEDAQAGRKPPFFVVGAQRSGTTMLRLMLNNHPNITLPFESDFIPVFYRRLAEYGDLKREMSLADRIIFDQVAGSALDLFGYEREDHPATLGSRLKGFYYSVRRW
jgi:hypothetical protein